MKRSVVGKTAAAWIHQNLRSALRHPKYRWWVVTGSLLYLLNPLDIAPDALPVVGWIDDGLLATLVVSEVAQVVGSSIKERRTLTIQNKANSVTVKGASSVG